MLLCFSLVHANTIIAVMTFYFSKQIQNHHSLTWLMVTFVVSNICHSDNLNYSNSWTSSQLGTNMELLLTSISRVLITSVVSNWSYFDYLNYLEFLTTSSQLQKQKTINFSTQIQNYFLTSFSWAVVTFVLKKEKILWGIFTALFCNCSAQRALNL